MNNSLTQIALLVAIFSSKVLAVFDWAPYPPCAQTQLQNNAPESCDYGSATTDESDQTNACLCPDTAFIQDAASAIYLNCGCDDLSISANILPSLCSNSGSTSALTASEIVSAGDGDESTCQNSGTSSSTKGAGSGTNSVGGGGLSQETQIIIGVLIPTVAIIVALGAWLCPCPWPNRYSNRHGGNNIYNIGSVHGHNLRFQ